MMSQDTREHANTGTPLPYLCEWRRAAYLSQSQLARKAGLSKTTITALELPEERKRTKGAHPDTIQKLSRALGITPHKLVTQHPPPPDATRLP